MVSYSVIILPAARKELAAIGKRDRQRITAKIDALAEDPRPAGAVKLAGADDLWRVRQGDFRILYTIYDGLLVVQVVKVGHRREVYKRR